MRAIRSVFGTYSERQHVNSPLPPQHPEVGGGVAAHRYETTSDRPFRTHRARRNTRRVDLAAAGRPPHAHADRARIQVPRHGGGPDATPRRRRRRQRGPAAPQSTRHPPVRSQGAHACTRRNPTPTPGADASAPRTPGTARRLCSRPRRSRNRAAGPGGRGREGGRRREKREGKENGRERRIKRAESTGLPDALRSRDFSPDADASAKSVGE